MNDPVEQTPSPVEQTPSKDEQNLAMLSHLLGIVSGFIVRIQRVGATV
jgi:hypothetical protein